MSCNLMDTVLRMVNTDAEPEDYKGEDGLLYLSLIRIAERRD